MLMDAIMFSSGDIHMITLTDMFGFECFHRNRTEQLMINSLNEQIQYHYNQRMFVWEMMEQVGEQFVASLLCNLNFSGRGFV